MRELSPSAKHNYQKVLIAALNHAVREGIMPHNPSKQLPCNECIEHKEEEREFLSIEEQKKLFALQVQHRTATLWVYD